jgi:6-phosphogluconolactonase
MGMIRMSSGVPGRMAVALCAAIGFFWSDPASSGNKNSDKQNMVYVGTYTGKGSKGIYVFQFNPATGETGSVILAATTDNPSFLASQLNGRTLYAVNEIGLFEGQPSGAVTVFSRDPETGLLRALQQVSSLGPGPAYVSLDGSGKNLLVANYGGGNIAVFPIASDGTLRQHSAFMQAHGSSINHARQEGPHAHCILTTPDNRKILVADLGIDKLLVYDFDEKTGQVKVDSSRSQSMEPGAGPRHIAVAPTGRHLYVVNELNSSVSHFACDAAKDELTRMESVSTLPSGFSGGNTTAEILIDGDGRHLYVSNRGDDSIVLFQISPGDGSLKFMERVSCGGKSPRSIALDSTGNWMFAANQLSNTITQFRVNRTDGRLTPTSRALPITSPVCILSVSSR